MCVFFFKQKTAYEMRISDWSSDVCSSDLRALTAAEERGEIDYSSSEKVSNSDYVRVMREYAEGGAKLIVGEAFGVSREARRVADDSHEVAFLMGDSGQPHGCNYAAFDNLIHAPGYMMGVLAGSLPSRPDKRTVGNEC